MTRFLVAWAVLSVPASIVVGRAIARRSCVVAPSLEERLAPHVPDVRVADFIVGAVTQLPGGWVGISSDRWPA